MFIPGFESRMFKFLPVSQVRVSYLGYRAGSIFPGIIPWEVPEREEKLPTPPVDEGKLITPQHDPITEPSPSGICSRSAWFTLCHC